MLSTASKMFIPNQEIPRFARPFKFYHTQTLKSPLQGPFVVSLSNHDGTELGTTIASFILLSDII